MAPWRYDPYLWVHLAGLATVPLWIDLCLLGLAVGNPALPGLELGLIGALGVLPVLLMQLRRPFYIFSLPGIALRPAALSNDQRRLLSQFRRWRVRLGALLVPVPLVWVLIKLYPLAFLARGITPFGDWGRLGGMAVATVSFLLANLFLQVPVAVLQVLATSDRRMADVTPYPTEAVAAHFSWLGLPVSKLLPNLAPIPEGAVSSDRAPASLHSEAFAQEDAVPGIGDEAIAPVDPAIAELSAPLAAGDPAEALTAEADRSPPEQAHVEQAHVEQAHDREVPPAEATPIAVGPEPTLAKPEAADRIPPDSHHPEPVSGDDSPSSHPEAMHPEAEDWQDSADPEAIVHPETTAAAPLALDIYP
ncbi:low-complexity tail membrane protein [Leptolyngbya sp. KIOST-1]|uniref:low-complexity tail membrane protein n=1 Tax=Leptolyngbya sp. KIOST-1 TaxID=1229172 RepID=UPI00068B087B|nr:low-complexity tail membrane protein [Leptolyngbya sp. KIOST-1]